MKGALLTLQNPKIKKGEKRGFRTALLHLAPHTLSGYNVCPLATPGCWTACLNTAGRGGIGLDSEGLNVIQRARIARTVRYFEDRDAFMAQLVRELARFFLACARDGFTPAVRLNGTSDIRWENVPVMGAPNIMSHYRDIQFYDYTKLSNRKGLPKNYHLTYSLAETARNFKAHFEAFENGMNVAVVLGGFGDSRYPKPFPPTFNNRRLIDGDKTDLRFLDPKGCYVGLRAKGRAKKDTSGFVRTIERVTQ